MTHKPVVKVFVDSQGRATGQMELIIPPWRDDDGSIGPASPVIGAAGKALRVLFDGDADSETLFLVRMVPDTYNFSPDLEGLRDFNEGVDEDYPPLIQVYPYHCGICHEENVYAEDPELEDFEPYHVHGKPYYWKDSKFERARTWRLRRLTPRWVPKNTPGVLYTQRSGDT